MNQHLKDDPIELIREIHKIAWIDSEMWREPHMDDEDIDEADLESRLDKDFFFFLELLVLQGQSVNGPKTELERIELHLEYIAALTIRDSRFSEIFERLINERESRIRDLEAETPAQKRAKQYLQDRLAAAQ